MWKSRTFLLLIAGYLTITGCAVTRITNLTPAYLQFNPSVQSYKDPSFQESKYRTFSVFPSSLITNKTQLGGGILEKQMLFALRNVFEELGYKFVELNQSPDFLVTLDGSAPYREVYVPPQTVTVPYWVPGQTITTYGSTSGSFNYNTYGRYSSYGWGTYSGTTTGTTHVPGYMTTQTYTRPGYTTGAFYPSIVVSVFDGRTTQNVWNGTGVGTSYNSDLRVSSQLVLRNVLRQFPLCAYADQNYPMSSGVLGIGLSTYTNDGNNYFPTVVQLLENSPASNGGIEVYDMILAVDEIATQNRPLSDIRALLRGNPGSKVAVTLWRVDKRLDIELVRSHRSQ